jgi:signal transduction histidine kinase
MPRIDSFIPTILAITFVTDLVTAVLLFSQFSATGSRALLVLASGYLFSSLIVIPHALTFPGAFAPAGLLGAGSQSTAWLNVSWRFGLAVASVGYAVLASGKHTQDALYSSRQPAVFWSVTAVFIGVCVLTGIVTVGDRFMPRLILAGPTVSPLGHQINGLTALLNMVVLLLLWRRGRSVLDLWLMVSVAALLCETAMVALFITSRFSVGFYGVRTISLLVSKVVLIVLLAETMRLYARLFLANRNLERERTNRLTSAEAVVAAIAHEIRQPLASISAQAGSGKLVLGRGPPGVAEAAKLFQQVQDGAFRANEVFQNFLMLIQENAQEYEAVDINVLTRDAISLVRKELEDNSVTVVANLEPGLPIVAGHTGQLREVLLNLIQNSIEAMATMTDAPRVIEVVTSRHDPKSIIISVHDTGRGIEPQRLASIFDPFITTKSHGTGLGLAICKMIVEQHGGKITAASASVHGTQFDIALPIAKSSVSASADGRKNPAWGTGTRRGC